MRRAPRPTAGILPGFAALLLALLTASAATGCGVIAAGASSGGAPGIVADIDVTTAVVRAATAPTFSGTRVPILMYHRIEQPPADGSNAVYYVSPKKFEQ
ncbi:MAG: hypothetical protein FJ000_06135, partial [Actinobacteria bacterium]|nr:hypothetical protein [Actinomycetota bacterium]